ncbi:MAG: hypothetical protein GY757_11620 [bacterium]|nr:hypothetical protein [bacterium]
MGKDVRLIQLTSERDDISLKIEKRTLIKKDLKITMIKRQKPVLGEVSLT